MLSAVKGLILLPVKQSDKKAQSKSNLLVSRAHLLWLLRSFFHQEGFLEIEVPSVVYSPGLEPQLDAFEVKTIYAQQVNPARRWLHTSPEYALKRFLGTEGSGVNRVYALSSCFRDELPSMSHSPEFTMLEWYARDLSLEQLMTQCEKLIRHLAQEANSLGFSQGSWLSSEEFERLSVREAFVRYAGIDLELCSEVDQLRIAAQEAGIRTSALHGEWDELYFQVFMDLVEPHLGKTQPTFLYNFPSSQAALAKLEPTDPRWARRFELFISGIELANAFDELSDPQEQRVRFEDDLRVRYERQAQTPPIDELLLQSLPKLGDCVGIALGFDRLMMLLLDCSDINQVRLQSWSQP